MGKVTELVNWGFDVVQVLIPVVDEQGLPVANGDGKPKTKAGKALVMVDQQTGEQLRLVLSVEAAGELVRQLTGGVHVPQVGRMAVPKGKP